MKGKAPTANDVKNIGRKDFCSRCGAKDRMTYQWPTKSSLHLGKEEDNKPSKQEEAKNEDQRGEAVYYADDLVDSDVEASISMVVRQVLAAPMMEKEDCGRTTIFQTLVTCGEELLKLVIDEGSCMNVISASAIEKVESAR